MWRSFEQFVLAKTYFDPEGLILACDGDCVLGFVHAAFGANDAEDGISNELGTTALLMVRPGCDEAQVAAGCWNIPRIISVSGGQR